MKMHWCVKVGLSLFLLSVPLFAQDEKDALNAGVQHEDAMFWDAYNRCDVEKMSQFFWPDIEFYHDKGGLTNHQQTREGFSKMFGNMSDIKRTLVPDTLHIYPIKDYGAIELGTHRFCHKENGKDDCGDFPFVMIWKKVGNSWKVARVVSYGH